LYNPKTDDCDSTESFVLVNDLAVRSIVMLYQKTEVNNNIYFIIQICMIIKINKQMKNKIEMINVNNNYVRYTCIFDFII